MDKKRYYKLQENDNILGEKDRVVPEEIYNILPEKSKEKFKESSHRYNPFGSNELDGFINSTITGITVTATSTILGVDEDYDEDITEDISEYDDEDLDF